MMERSRKIRRCAKMVIAVTLITLVSYIIKVVVRGNFTQDYFVVIAQCITIFLQSKTIIGLTQEEWQ